MNPNLADFLATLSDEQLKQLVAAMPQIEGFDVGRERLKAIRDRHRSAAVAALTRAAIDRAEARKDEIDALYDAAVAGLARVAGEAAMNVLALARAFESLRKTDLASAARNIATAML